MDKIILFMKTTIWSIARKKALISILLLIALASFPLAHADELAQLRTQLELLNQRISELESQQKEPLQLPRQPEIVLDTRGLRITSPDKSSVLRVNGLIQLDGRFYLNSEARQRGGADTFDLRRVRPTLQGNLTPNLGYRFTPELSGNVRILDAYGDFSFAESNSLRFGNFKTPVGLSRLQGAANLPFNERGFAAEFTPARDLGVQLQSRFASNTITTKAGIFNGAVDGSNGAPGNSNGDFSSAGSIFFEPFRNNTDSAFRGLGFGLAGSYGKFDGNAGFRVRGPNRLDVARNPNIIENGNAYRINPSLYYYHGSFGLLAEYIVSSRDLGLNANNTNRYTNQAWTIETSYFLTGERNSYGRVNPTNPITGDNGNGLGALELALRYTGLKLDTDLFNDGLLNNLQSERANSFGLGLNWYLTNNLNVLFSFDHTLYSGGGAGGGNRQSDNTLLSRLQVAF